MVIANEPLHKVHLGILGHLHEFRTGTEETAAKTLSLAKECAGAHLDFLVSSQLVRRKEFLDGTHRYELSPFGARVLGLPRCHGREVGKQALVERWAVLWFCVLESERVRRLVNPTKEPGIFPQLQGQRLPQPYFFVDERAGSTSLGYLLVDHAGRKRHFFQRTDTKVNRLQELFAVWIENQSLAVTVLTTHARRRDQLEKDLRQMFGNLINRVLVVPGLSQIIG